MVIVPSILTWIASIWIDCFFFLHTGTFTLFVQFNMRPFTCFEVSSKLRISSQGGIRKEMDLKSFHWQGIKLTCSERQRFYLLSTATPCWLLWGNEWFGFELSIPFLALLHLLFSPKRFCTQGVMLLLLLDLSTSCSDIVGKIIPTTLLILLTSVY